jgi:hypothetical protein
VRSAGGPASSGADVGKKVSTTCDGSRSMLKCNNTASPTYFQRALLLLFLIGAARYSVSSEAIPRSVVRLVTAPLSRSSILTSTS